MKCNDSVNGSPTTNTTILLWKSFFKMLFNSIFRNVNVTLHHEYAHNRVCYISWKEKFSFGAGGRVGDSAPSFWIFWIRPWSGRGLSQNDERSYQSRHIDYFTFNEMDRISVFGVLPISKGRPKKAELQNR